MDHYEDGTELSALPNGALHQLHGNVHYRTDIIECEGELGSVPSTVVLPDSSASANEVSLAPVDRGFGAWSFVRVDVQQ